MAGNKMVINGFANTTPNSMGRMQMYEKKANIYHGLVQIAVVLMLGLASQLFGMFVGVQYAYAKKAYLIFPLTIVGTMINVGANIILIPHWGILGAAWAGVIGGYGLNLLLVFIGQRIYKVTYPWATLFAMHAILWVAVLGVFLSCWSMLVIAVALYIAVGQHAKILDQLKEERI